ncbi:FtsQ-type POTRA domain-containing protein [Tsukamurella asaccharolytica]|uniref:FtsQ-type POTRA domain-containing protein n=1 Tax=Tsukamurella asaccharolytica TaxID=2592067 RepID=A0A5C5RA88_9ACTN|nr:FtsQ-type POTRA domain-containing protein [Tsukamurella asaccharolytica]TWS19686.1 FtsQ-type POTRA domain-containing protein [Tsukamurella asaccharolytica]
MSSPATRRRVPGLRRLLLILLALAVVAGLGAAAYFSPVLSARDVSVTGATNAPADRVAAVVEPLKGRPLLQITPGQRDAYAAQVLAVSPWIDRATVTVSYPSTLVVEVTEREVVAYAQLPAGTVLVDAKGVPFIKVGEPPILTPKLTVRDPKADDPATEASIAVLKSLPPDLHGQVLEIEADSPANVRFVLRDKRVVNWGDDQRTADKTAALRMVLTRPGREFTVINPDMPTAR